MASPQEERHFSASVDACASRTFAACCLAISIRHNFNFVAPQKLHNMKKVQCRTHILWINEKSSFSSSRNIPSPSGLFNNRHIKPACNLAISWKQEVSEVLRNLSYVLRDKGLLSALRPSSPPVGPRCPLDALPSSAAVRPRRPSQYSSELDPAADREESGT